MPTPDIRELTTEAEYREAFPVLGQLRNDLTEAEYLDYLGAMRKEGYHLFGLDDDGLVTVAGVALRTDFYNGRHLFVSDLVTREDRRSEGHGAAMMAFLEEWARERGCESITLESGLWREDAHRFYEELDMEKFCYTFRKEFDG